MIYLVTKKHELFNDPDYTIINAQQALEIMQNWKIIQYDSETSGRLQNDLQTINNILKVLYI
jgi:hypothetical protein